MFTGPPRIFFSCIRSRGGWNNNPNSQQLKWVLRQLLYRNAIASSVTANCTEFESYCNPAFEFRSESRQNQDISQTKNDDHEIATYINCLENKNLSDFQENVIFYISGYIVRCLINDSTCHHCIEILLHRNNNHSVDHTYSAPSEHFQKFTNFVSRGGLIYPSNVYKIIQFFRTTISTFYREGKNQGKRKKINYKYRDPLFCNQD